MIGHQGKMPVMQRIRFSNCDHLEELLGGEAELGDRGGWGGGLSPFLPGQGHVLSQTESVVLAGFLWDDGGVGVGFRASPELPHGPAYLYPHQGCYQPSPSITPPPLPLRLQPGSGHSA